MKQDNAHVDRQSSTEDYSEESRNSHSIEWPTEPSSYSLERKIGQGAFASVWRALDKDRQRLCAVKIINLDNIDTNLAEIRREVQAMRLSSHPNILGCYTAFVHDVNLWLLTPIMSKGSSLYCLQTARSVLFSQGAPPMSMENHILYILCETLHGLQYIHGNGQIHRDIKAGNILLDGNGDVRIADFGVSGWLVQGGSQEDRAMTFVGTPCWMAPEVMEQVHGYDYLADIWSLGITALELARGYAPYAKYPPMKVLILTIQEEPPNLHSYTDDGSDNELADREDYSKSFQSLVQLCLSKDPSRRPSCQELLQSKYFMDMDNMTLLHECRQRIRSEVCDLVPDVGSLDAQLTSSQDLPGNSPVSILHSQDKDRPPGTTWIFADGSQVLSSTMTAETVDDVMEQLVEFGKQTGGEHYDRCQTHGDTNHAGHDEDADDIIKFMDEFEQSTAGEDFRHPSKLS